MKPTLSTSPSSSARSSPSNALGPSHWTRFSTPSGRPPARNSSVERLAERRRVLGRLPDDRVAAQQRRDEVPGRDGHREVARGDDRGDADRVAEREQLLVRQLARHGLAVEPPPLAEEEVAGVDHLLHLAQRLGVGLADLAREQARQRLLVVLHQPPDAPIAFPRTGAGVAAQPGWAARAARQASANAPASASTASQTTSSRFAGLRDSTRVPPSRSRPPMIEATLLVSVTLMRPSVAAG